MFFIAASPVLRASGSAELAAEQYALRQCLDA